MNLTYHSAVEAELTEAARFYESRRPGYGAKFRRAVDAAVTSILSDPTRFAADEDGTRRCRVQNFPYSIYFVVELADDLVRILVVTHHSRDSDYWKDRL